jgi:C4-dicarboxylate-specific signal transduction histidine kinase
MIPLDRAGQFCSRRLTLITLLVLTLVTGLAGGIGGFLIIGTIARTQSINELEHHVDFGERFASLVAAQMEAGATPAEVAKRLQQTIQASAHSGRYLCVLSSAGKVLCHPDAGNLGAQADVQFLPPFPGPADVPLDFAAWVAAGHRDGLLVYQGTPLELVRRIPIAGTDWQVLVHTRLDALQSGARALALKIIAIMLPTGIFFILFGTLAVRWIGGRFEHSIVRANQQLEERVAERTRTLQTTVEELNATRHALDVNEKLALLGQFIAGIAHEINNPLHVISIQAENLKEAARDDDEKRACESIARNAQRAGLLVKNLLSYARNDPPRRSLVPIAELVDAALDLAHGQTHRHAIRVVREYPGAPDSVHVFADRVQLEQVILNLVGNAAQALAPQSGDKWIRIQIESLPDETTRLVVEDNGPGLEEKIRARLFEPFQTTKPEGLGTGLGLSLCKRFVVSNGGTIRYEDPPTGGARFIVELPAVGVEAGTVG